MFVDASDVCLRPTTAERNKACGHAQGRPQTMMYAVFLGRAQTAALRRAIVSSPLSRCPRNRNSLCCLLGIPAPESNFDNLKIVGKGLPHVVRLETLTFEEGTVQDMFVQEPRDRNVCPVGKGCLSRPWKQSCCNHQHMLWSRLQPHGNTDSYS